MHFVKYSLCNDNYDIVILLFYEENKQALGLWQMG